MRKNRETGAYYTQQFNRDSELKVAMEGWNEVQTDIGSTAWWVPKFSADYSIFHSLYTYNISSALWKGYKDGVEDIDISNSTRIISDQGWLKMTTTATNGSRTKIVSKRSPRYQPNRWHLYSTTMASADIGTTGSMFRFGLGTINNGTAVDGTFFEIEDDQLYIVVKSGWVERQRKNITSNLEDIGLSITDLQKWHLYDIQFQYRGVGDYFFYIDQYLVGKLEFLGEYETPIMENPQLPAFYQVKNVTAWKELEMRSGCVDITSEGGKQGGLTDVSKANDDLVTIPNDTDRHPLLLVKVPNEFNGKINTRNSRLLRLTGTPFSKNMRFGFSITRDTTAIGWTLWESAFNEIDPNGSLEYVDYSVNTEDEVSFDFTKAKTVFKAATPTDTTIIADEPSPDLDLYFTGGDYICLFAQNIKTGTGWEAEGILEFWEEI